METNTLLRAAYLMLQRLSNDSAKVAIETDRLRANLRNKIAEIDGSEPEAIQKECESLALGNPIRKF